MFASLFSWCTLYCPVYAGLDVGLSQGVDEPSSQWRGERESLGHSSQCAWPTIGGYAKKGVSARSFASGK